MSDPRFDGASASDIAATCGVPRVSLHTSVTSTMDVAHALARDGAAAGTLVLAEQQTAGRGRNGRSWDSVPGESVTFTVVERPQGTTGVGVLSLRLGIVLAARLDAFAAGTVGLKWPNDLLVNGDKLLGLLVEARWRSGHLEWVAIGVGLNVVPPRRPGAAGLAPGASRMEILAQLVPAVRAAAASPGELTHEELGVFAARDWSYGRRVLEPAAGTARGIASNGALMVETEAGMVACLAGSLVLVED